MTSWNKESRESRERSEASDKIREVILTEGPEELIGLPETQELFDHLVNTTIDTVETVMSPSLVDSYGYCRECGEPAEDCECESAEGACAVDVGYVARWCPRCDELLVEHKAKALCGRCGFFLDCCDGGA